MPRKNARPAAKKRRSKLKAKMAKKRRYGFHAPSVGVSGPGLGLALAVAAVHGIKAINREA